MKNIIREKLAHGGAVLATRVHLTWPMIYELIGKSNQFDYVEFMAEYAPYNQGDLENICRASELHGLGTLIKVDFENRKYVAQKAIASGFQGLLFTDHETSEQIEDTLKAIRPANKKYKGSLGFVNRRWIGCEEFPLQQVYADEVSKTVVGFMIEKEKAVENIDAICATEGVDFIQFGPADFAMNCNLNSKVDVEQIKAAELKVIKAAQKHNVSLRVEVRDASQLDEYINLGIQHFAIGTDIRALKTFWVEEGSKTRQLLRDKKQ